MLFQIHLDMKDVSAVENNEGQQPTNVLKQAEFNKMYGLWYLWSM